MCGIAGFFNSAGLGSEADGRLQRMLSSIRHRGPDDQGTWLEGGVALGHRRLSIVDLSPLGHQPMASSSGRYVIVFNGEIYNHQALRGELQDRGAFFRGHSDTETLLALIEAVGFESALKRCIGMFAIALWDRQRRTLMLARDRLGEKPLYFVQRGSLVAFASELKAMRTLPDIGFSVNAEAVHDILSYGYIRDARSIIDGVQQVAPGQICEFAADGASLRQRNWAYWSAHAAAVAGFQHSFSGSFDEAIKSVTELLGDAVKLQMQADVPLGAFLSGGIDSSLVVALMQRQASQAVRTYSIGFHDQALDEASYAKAVAAHLGTQHTEWYVDESEVLNLVPGLANYYDEPMADPSQLPTLILARLTRKDVTVALSGDGADELFGGYPKYWRGARQFHRPGRRALGAAAHVMNDWVTKPAMRHLPPSMTNPWPLHRVEGVASLFSAGTRQVFIDQLNRLNRGALDFMPAKLRTIVRHTPPSLIGEQLSMRREAMLVDAMNYLPGDILVKVDRATMQASLESRAPFLDHRLFEFAATLPDSYLFGNNQGKTVLRSALARLLPLHLIDRPKAGFSPPIGRWLRGSLKDWAQSLLADRATADVLDVNACQHLLARHCETQFDLSARLWPMLSIANWYREAKSG